MQSKRLRIDSGALQSKACLIRARGVHREAGVGVDSIYSPPKLLYIFTLLY